MYLTNDQARCLAHVASTPRDWCERRESCARAVQFRHDSADDLANSVIEPRLCKTPAFEKFIDLVPVSGDNLSV